MKARLILDWLGSPGNIGTELGYKIARFAAEDIGVCEEPPGTNRGTQIDEYNLVANSPLGSFWCATFAGHKYKKAGAIVPRAYGDCDTWLRLGEKLSCLYDDPAIGALALYGKPNDIVHVGIVVRLYPYKLTVEGNTTLEGFSRNGEIVTLKRPQANIVKYFYPSHDTRSAVRP